MSVVAELVTPKFLALYVYIASFVMVHYRGRVRHGWKRQLTDHSTFFGPYNALVYLFSGVPNTPMQDLRAFPDLAPLRDNWQTIREEAQRLYDSGQIRGAEKHNDIAFNTFFKRGWKRFYLKWYDDFMPSAVETCPKTVELVRSIPTVNAAMFALLPPGGRLGEHRDPFAGSLRYHLGLVTPNDDACRIYIDGTVYSWRDGEAVLFDETYVHSAVNETDRDRIILFCDVERPIRNSLMRAVNRFVARRILKATKTQNVPGERVGFVNRVSRYVYSLRMCFQSLKRMNRRAYYIGKYVLYGFIAYLLFVRPLIGS